MGNVFEIVRRRNLSFLIPSRTKLPRTLSHAFSVHVAIRKSFQLTLSPHFHWTSFCSVLGPCVCVDFSHNLLTGLPNPHWFPPLHSSCFARDLPTTEVYSRPHIHLGFFYQCHGSPTSLQDLWRTPSVATCLLHSQDRAPTTNQRKLYPGLQMHHILFLPRF